MKTPHSSTITIIICTFNRHDLLRTALESIAALSNPNSVPLSVIVVDNSDDSNALPLIEEMSSRFPWPLRGIEAHPPDISVARNAGVAAASSSDLVAFIDDDQTLPPHWLEAVMNAVETYPHDIFFGRVDSRFEAPERAGRTVRALFSRQLDASTGEEVFAMGPQKTKSVSLGTGNSVFRRATTLTDPIPFDPAFGSGGGEDYNLFCRLQRRGRRFAWLEEAYANENVPASRCDPDYVARRLFAGGQAYALAVSLNSPAPVLERWRQRLIAMVQLGLFIPVWLRQIGKPQEERDEVRFRMAGILGKLSFKTLKPIYREERR